VEDAFQKYHAIDVGENCCLDKYF